MRIYVSLPMRPWIMQACHSTASCPLSTKRILRMLERFYWWIGMRVNTRWWLRHCLKYQARKKHPTDCPMANHLHASPGRSWHRHVDYFGRLPATPRDDTYIVLITDRFSRRADMFAVTATEFTAEGTANVLVNKYIPLWGARAPCSRTIASISAVSFRKLSTSFWESASLPQAPIIQTVTEALSG